MIKFRQKYYTQWDATDTLKQMKDSDILAEQKKKNPSRIGNALKTGGVGSVIGGTLGAVGSAMRGGDIVSGFKSGAIVGGSLGAIGGATMVGNKQRKENNFYNNRLEYAQRQALRREKKDWKNNMTQREGYTY